MNCRSSSQLIELGVNWDQSVAVTMKGLDNAAISITLGLCLNNGVH